MTNLIQFFYTIILPSIAPLKEGVFLHGDKDETNPVNLYFFIGLFFTLDTFNHVQVYKPTKTIEAIKREHRHEILTYCLGKYTEAEEVYNGDIFIHGEHVQKLATDQK